MYELLDAYNELAIELSCRQGNRELLNSATSEPLCIPVVVLGCSPTMPEDEVRFNENDIVPHVSEILFSIN